MQAHLISMENKYNANQLQQQYQRKVQYYYTGCGVNCRLASLLIAQNVGGNVYKSQS